MHCLRGRFFAPLSLAALTLTSACGGHSRSLPQTPAPQQHAIRAASSTTIQASLFHSNSEKYSDTGSHPATGRSGSATIQSRALLAKDGTALLEVTTGTLDAEPGPGNIRHLTMTPLRPDGSPDDTLAYNNLNAGGYWQHTYSNLARNQNVRIDSNITDLDPRTDVVTTIDTLKKRPDLFAKEVAGPPTALTNQPVTFTATVAEINGDVGAHADCVLSVDGQQVDQALGIWVDAAGTVSCAFQTSFATTGLKHISVSVVNVVPGDWDTSNNTAQTTIEIVDSSVQLRTYAHMSNYSWTQPSTTTITTPSETYSESDSAGGANTNGYIEGYTYGRQFQFPLNALSSTVNVDGADAYTGTFTAGSVNPPQASNGQTCQYGWGDGLYGYVCSSSNYTVALMNIYGYQATYFSSVIDTQCQSNGCSTYSWTSSSDTTNGGVFDLGNTDVFSLNVTDAIGTQYEGVTAPAATGMYGLRNPWSMCWPLNPGTECQSGTYTETGKSVSANST